MFGHVQYNITKFTDNKVRRKIFETETEGQSLYYYGSNETGAKNSCEN